jgi:uncharacterized membrane protein
MDTKATASFDGISHFQSVEGIMDHRILRLHHVNETGSQQQWIYWDIGFLVWSALMFLDSRGRYRVLHQA